MIHVIPQAAIKALIAGEAESPLDSMIYNLVESYNFTENYVGHLSNTFRFTIPETGFVKLKAKSRVASAARIRLEGI